MKTAAGKVTPWKENGHTVLVDEQYFRVERWTLDSASQATKLSAACNNATIRSPKAALLFVSQGMVEIAADGGAPFSLGRCELAVLPASANNITVEPVDTAEVLRILPR